MDKIAFVNLHRPTTLRIGPQSRVAMIGVPPPAGLLVVKTIVVVRESGLCLVTVPTHIDLAGLRVRFIILISRIEPFRKDNRFPVREVRLQERIHLLLCFPNLRKRVVTVAQIRITEREEIERSDADATTRE